MPSDPPTQDQSNPQYGAELLLVTVGSVLLVVALVAIAATTGVALLVLAVVAMSILAAVIAALVLRMTSDPAEDRGLPSPATRPGRPRTARPCAQARPIHPVAHAHIPARVWSKAVPGAAGRISSNVAYASAPGDNRPALTLEVQRQREGANDAG
jgi:hypothetical protein